MWATILLALLAQVAIVRGFEAPLEIGCPQGSRMDSEAGV